MGWCSCNSTAAMTGRHRVSIIAEACEAFIGLELRSLEKETHGRYELKVEEIRLATAKPVTALRPRKLLRRRATAEGVESGIQSNGDQ